MFGRVTFYPTLIYNVMMEKVSTRRWFDRIDETVILGALPWRKITHQLMNDEKVGGIVSMNENYELNMGVTKREEWQKLGVKFLQLQTADIFHAPSQDNLDRGVSFIKSFDGTGNSVYVHCKAGRTRSATLVACYLIQKYNLKPREAVELIITKRPHILLRSKQWSAIEDFYERKRKE
ncbi:protein tyrosine phosphatase, mitochondrial 1 isoform X2 [Brevipalpus obovatus]